MDKFTKLTATACPINQANLNTDQILPARYLKWPRSKGLGTVLFQDLRIDDDGKERADFPLNQQAYRDARILIAARNFGGGSSWRWSHNFQFERIFLRVPSFTIPSKAPSMAALTKID